MGSTGGANKGRAQRACHSHCPHTLIFHNAYQVSHERDDSQQALAELQLKVTALQAAAVRAAQLKDQCQELERCGAHGRLSCEGTHIHSIFSDPLVAPLDLQEQERG